MFKIFVFFLALLKTSTRASMSKRAAFLIEAGLMIINNLMFFSVWWIFFKQFTTIDGWTLKDMAVLSVVGMGSYGLMNICFGGIKHLSKMIVNGDLDPFMTQPKNLLLHIAGSRSFSKGWGHIMTCVILSFFCITSFSSFLLILLSILSGCLVFTSINIIAHSLSFWMGSIESVSKKYCDALYLFALYPTNIYSGILQLVMFTLIPAGVISYLPVELVRHFSWIQLLLLVVSSVFFFAVSFLVFYSGLKRYESGNKFGVRV